MRLVKQFEISAHSRTPITRPRNVSPPDEPSPSLAGEGICKFRKIGKWPNHAELRNCIRFRAEFGYYYEILVDSVSNSDELAGRRD